MFMWPILLIALLIVLFSIISLGTQREDLAKARVIAFLARRRCPDCGRAYGLLERDSLERVFGRWMARFGGTADIFDACCDECGAHQRLAVRKGDVVTL